MDFEELGSRSLQVLILYMCCICLFYIIGWFSSVWIDGFKEENMIASGAQEVYVENCVVSRNCVGLDINREEHLPWLYTLWTSNEISHVKLFYEYSYWKTKMFFISLAQASLIFKDLLEIQNKKSTKYYRNYMQFVFTSWQCIIDFFIQMNLYHI